MSCRIQYYINVQVVLDQMSSDYRIHKPGMQDGKSKDKTVLRRRNIKNSELFSINDNFT